VSGGDPACFNLPAGATVVAFLGLGSNVGDRGSNLRAAIARIGNIAAIEQTSNVYETEPVGHKDQPDFWNLVVRCSTDLPARELMHKLIEIEQSMGRERTFKNAPRNIDIDILLYDDVIMSDSDLQIPHPRMSERAFVLKPLLELAPDLVDPRTHVRYADVLAAEQLERAEVIGEL
jgi:2-amino-4-hydroxy-6-hydroxymethyldihydropteridine diphosphokinase